MAKGMGMDKESIKGTDRECGEGRAAEGIIGRLRKVLKYHKTGLELLKIAHKVDSAAIPLRIINSVLQVTGTYLTLYLTAEFIDTLLAGRFSEGFFRGCAVVLTGLFRQPNWWKRLMGNRPSGAVWLLRS